MAKSTSSVELSLTMRYTKIYPITKTHKLVIKKDVERQL